MTENPRILVQRRNLPAGFIRFRQIGNAVQFTQDLINWHTAFYLPDCAGGPADDIRQLVAIYGENTPAGDRNGKGETVIAVQNCALARALVTYYEAIITQAIDAQEDASNDWLSTMLALAGGAVALIALANPVGAVLGLTATALTYLAAGLGLSAAGLEFLDALDGVQPLTPAQREDFICCVKTALDTAFSRASISSIECANVPAEFTAAWNELMSSPEAWAGVVAASKDNFQYTGESGCCEDACYYAAALAYDSIGVQTAEDGRRLKTINVNEPDSLVAVPKYLVATYSFPPIVAGKVAVDVVSVDPFAIIGGAPTVAFAPYSPQGPVSAPNGGELVAGRGTYESEINNPNYPIISVTVTVRQAYANNSSTNLPRWRASTAWLENFRICPKEV